MSINPIRTGHALVVPVEEVDRWTDASAGLMEHLVALARRIAAAQREAFRPERVALIVAGFEVPHLHLHVIPAETMADIDFANAAPSVDPAELEDAAARIRAALWDSSSGRRLRARRRAPAARDPGCARCRPCCRRGGR